MKYPFLLAATICATMTAYADTQFASELTRLQQEQQRAEQAALAPVNRRYADALQSLLRRTAAASDFDTAAKIKAELDKLGVAAAQTAAPSSTTTASPATGTAKNSFTIDSRSETGTLVGPAKKRQKLHLQYADGLWATNGKEKVSPEQPPHGFAQVAIVGVIGGQAEVIGVVPGGTKNKPYVETFTKDYDEIRLRINDTSKSDNSGEVIYKASIH